MLQILVLLNANPVSNIINKGPIRIINAGLIDTFRLFNPEGGHYTWWSYMRQARERNIGWRIDYYCASNILMKNIKSSLIFNKIMGSDHAPIVLEMDI